jgi:hypothetical protein
MDLEGYSYTELQIKIGLNIKNYKLPIFNPPPQKTNKGRIRGGAGVEFT